MKTDKSYGTGSSRGEEKRAMAKGTRKTYKKGGKIKAAKSSKSGTYIRQQPK
jgi:hypothetical protein